MNNISKKFPITTEEYIKLEEKFGKLCYYAAWQLNRRNSNNNHNFEIEDFQQELMISILRAGSYYKRQCYIEESFENIKKNVTRKTDKLILNKLIKLWNNRTKHGANRQVFGDPEEIILDKLVKKTISKNLRPNKLADLVLDTKFCTYAKQILWNCQRSIGKKITKERPIRVGQVSLSDFDYLSCPI